MKLLLINFEMAMDSPVLAWQHQVAVQLARTCERVVVITQRIGRIAPPDNMEIHCIPTWLCRFPIRLVGTKWLANWTLWRVFRTHAFDACFVHMNTEWVYRFYPWFHVMRIPVLLWYAHGTVSWRLKLAHRLVDRAVTSSPEGFRVQSPKLRGIGQGIDTDLFRIPLSPRDTADMVSIGRLSERKRIGLMIEVIKKLHALRPDVHFRLLLVGRGLTPRDRVYERRLRAKVLEFGLSDRVVFLGHIPLDTIPKIYESVFVHLNASKTGSMDKSVLEALACGCPVITTNEAYRDLLGRTFPELYAQDDRPEALAGTVLRVYESRGGMRPQAFRNLVVGQHDLQVYTEKILANLQELAVPVRTQIDSG